MQYEMTLYKLTVAYNGSQFHGFQRQRSNQQIILQNNSSTTGDDAPVPITTNTSNSKLLNQPQSVELSVRGNTAVLGNMKKRKWGRRGGDDGNNNNKNNSSSSNTTSWTVQECLEGTLRHWTGYDVDQIGLRFASRTDRGVHARGQVVTVHIPSPLPSSCSSLVPIEEQQQRRPILRPQEIIIKAINSRLPEHISIENVEICHALFNPRQNVYEKHYSYTIKYRRRRRRPRRQQHQHQHIQSTTWHGGGNSTSRDNDPDHILAWTPYQSSGDHQLGGPHSIRSALDPIVLWVCPWLLDDSIIPQLCEQLTGTHNYRCFLHKDERKKQQQQKQAKEGDVKEKDNNAIQNGNAFQETKSHDPHVLTIHSIEFRIISESSRHHPCNINANNSNINSGIGIGASIESDDVVVNKGEEDDEESPIVIAQISVKGPRFKRGMVRHLVGYCVDVARGSIPIPLTLEQLYSGQEDIANQIHAAPANGLCLEYVHYDKQSTI